MNKAQNRVFENIKEIDRPLARTIRKKIKSAKITSVRIRERLSAQALPVLMRECWRQRYAEKQDNVDKIDTFLGRETLRN